ncbi:hypothetical protein B0H14DRAFT_3439287 [Mycena olivaceomarginata]|nr:hypothetical protein B0H14DRAFT_3439287 [Mycena olivaceomarginata]
MLRMMLIPEIREKRARVLSVAGVADAIHTATYYWEYPHWAQERMPSSANSSYLPSFHQLSSTTTRPPFRTVFVGARNLHEIVLSSPTPDGLTTLIDSRFPRLAGHRASVCGLGSATTGHPTTSWMVDHQRRRPPSLLNLSEPSSPGGDLFPLGLISPVAYAPDSLFRLALPRFLSLSLRWTCESWTWRWSLHTTRVYIRGAGAAPQTNERAGARDGSAALLPDGADAGTGAAETSIQANPMHHTVPDAVPRLSTLSLSTITTQHRARHP